jgi:hypothetical protein
LTIRSVGAVTRFSRSDDDRDAEERRTGQQQRDRHPYTTGTLGSTE